MEDLRPIAFTSLVRDRDFYHSAYEQGMKMSSYLFDPHIQTNDVAQDVQPLAMIAPVPEEDEDIDAQSD